MSKRIVERLADGFSLLEGPVWDPSRGLLFADTEEGGVHLLDGDGNVTVVVPHRRGIGGLSLHERGGLVVSGRNLAYKPPGGGETVVILDPGADDGIVGFNDITTDAAGRVYAGSLGFRPTEAGSEPRPGALFVVELDGSVRCLAQGVKLTNGLAFSPDGRLLYHSDSGDRTVYVYAVHEDGGVGARQPFAVLPEGLPDGLVVSEDGAVWVAVAHGGVVLAFEPEGSLRHRIRFPVPMVTSLCFGGRDRRDLYVVTGSDGVPGGRAGAIFRLRTKVPGLAVAPARIAAGGEGRA